MSNYSIHFSNLRICEMIGGRVDLATQASRNAIYTLNGKDFSEIVKEFKEWNHERLKEAWIDVRHLRETPYKIQAVLSQLLIPYKEVLFHNQKVIECVDLLGEKKDLLFKWLSEESNSHSREDLLSNIHTLLTIDPEQSFLIDRLNPANRAFFLMTLVNGVSKIPPAFQERALDFMYSVPGHDWKQVLDQLNKLIEISPNSDITYAIFDAAEICDGENQLDVFKYTLMWHKLIQDPEFLPTIITHISYKNSEFLDNLSEDAKRFVGEEKGELMYEMLFFLSDYTAANRAKWVDRTSIALKDIPSNKKVAYIKKYLFIERVLSLFTTPIAVKRPEKTPLKYIR